MTKEVVTIDYLRPATSLKLPDDARAGNAMLSKSMYQVCFIYNLDFCDMVNGHQVHYKDYLVEAANVMVTDFLYNSRRVRQDWQPDHEKFLVDNMMAMLNLC